MNNMYIYLYIRRVHNIHKKLEGRSQRPEDNLYEYCALAQEMYGFCVTFVGSYGSEGVFFGPYQLFKMLPFNGALVARKSF